MLLSLYHPHQQWHMKRKSVNPGQMNTNLLCWHDTASLWHRASERILILLKNRIWFFSWGQESANNNKTKEPHFLATYVIRTRAQLSIPMQNPMLISVRGCKCLYMHVYICTHVLIRMTAMGKQSKPIWLMHVWYQMEHNPHKNKGLNTTIFTSLSGVSKLGTRGNTSINSQKQLGKALYSAAKV